MKTPTEIVDGYFGDRVAINREALEEWVSKIQQDAFDAGCAAGSVIPRAGCSCCGKPYPLVELWQMGFIRACRTCIQKMQEAEPPKCNTSKAEGKQ